MTDAEAITNAYKRHCKLLANVNEHNKAVVFDALAAAGVATVTVEFDGGSDQGQIESVIACAGEKHVDLPPSSVTLRRACWQKEEQTTTSCEHPLTKAIETLCYDYLGQEHGGWENNDGAFGTFSFDVAARTIELEFNGRFTDIATHSHSF